MIMYANQQNKYYYVFTYVNGTVGVQTYKEKIHTSFKIVIVCDIGKEKTRLGREGEGHTYLCN